MSPAIWQWPNWKENCWLSMSSVSSKKDISNGACQVPCIFWYHFLKWYISCKSMPKQIEGTKNTVLKYQHRGSKRGREEVSRLSLQKKVVFCMQMLPALLQALLTGIGSTTTSFSAFGISAIVEPSEDRSISFFLHSQLNHSSVARRAERHSLWLLPTTTNFQTCSQTSIGPALRVVVAGLP